MKNLYSLYLADKTLMMAIKENETRDIKNEMCVDKLAASCSSEMQLIIKKHLVRTQSQAYVYLFFNHGQTQFVIQTENLNKHTGIAWFCVRKD